MCLRSFAMIIVVPYEKTLTPLNGFAYLLFFIRVAGIEDLAPKIIHLKVAVIDRFLLLVVTFYFVTNTRTCSSSTQ